MDAHLDFERNDMESKIDFFLSSMIVECYLFAFLLNKIERAKVKWKLLFDHS